MTTGKSLLIRFGGIIGKIMGWVWQCDVIDDWQCYLAPSFPLRKNPSFKKSDRSRHQHTVHREYLFSVQVTNRNMYNKFLTFLLSYIQKSFSKHEIRRLLPFIVNIYDQE